MIERVSPDDLMMLACDVGPVPLQVGAVLVLDGGPGFDIAAAQAVLAERIAAIPRLRQRIARVPIGCGRPVWVDDPAFDIAAHLHSVPCPAPGDEAALLELAATVATRPLPWSAPPWSATFVGGLTGSRTAMIVVFHHVLADGIGGLAVLASLVDGAPSHQPWPAARRAPSLSELALDAIRSRRRAIARAFASPAVVPGRLRPAIAELNVAAAVPARRTTLTGPAGRNRRITVTRTDLRRVKDVAHANGATVNDVVLTAVTRSLHAFLARRGERLDDVVVSVIVSGRAATAPDQLGNRVGTMPVRLPACGDWGDQLAEVAAITKAHKTDHRGASAALLAPAFRTLAALGVVRWFLNRQWFVQVFVTNLRGPAERLSFAGAAVTDIYPITLIAGNVTLSFGVMSYAGTLMVVIMADPDRHRDLDALTDLLQRELDGLR